MFLLRTVSRTQNLGIKHKITVGGVVQKSQIILFVSSENKNVLKQHSAVFIAFIL